MEEGGGREETMEARDGREGNADRPSHESGLRPDQGRRMRAAIRPAESCGFVMLLKKHQGDFNHCFALCSKPKKCRESLFFLLCVPSRKSDFNHFFVLYAKPKKVI